MANFNFGSFTKNRVEAFSDGVFAVVVTLLVFDLKFTHIDVADNQKVWSGILSTLPKLLSWINSFLIVCVIWMNHHRLMDMFKGINAGIFWLNNILLMFTSMIPFPTSLLGEYTNTNAAACFYGLVLALPSLAFFILRLYVLKHKNLLSEATSYPAYKKGTMLALYYGPVLYLTGAALSLVKPWLGLAVYFFVPVYFIFPRAPQKN